MFSRLTDSLKNKENIKKNDEKSIKNNNEEDYYPNTMLFVYKDRVVKRTSMYTNESFWK